MGIDARYRDEATGHLENCLLFACLIVTTRGLCSCHPPENQSFIVPSGVGTRSTIHHRFQADRACGCLI
jgi:hypothetical protein